MTWQNFGDNTVEQISVRDTGVIAFSHSPYTYTYHRLGPDDCISIHDLCSYTVYVLQKDCDADIRLSGDPFKPEEGDAIQSENVSIDLSVKRGGAQLLVAGVTPSQFNLSSLTLIRHTNLFEVTKPWGRELWINGDHPGYAFKQIHIHAGTKTSLQYHREKEETITLFDGSGTLHYKSKRTIPNDEVQPTDVSRVSISSITSVHIKPYTLHRFAADTNITFYEVSTPHLDDVVRVQDDTGRIHSSNQTTRGVTN
jgi:mannose-6-phosphate isomerase-like protein (cupin superfamily)